MVQSIKKTNLAVLIIVGFYLLVSLYRLQDIPPPWYDEMVHLNTAWHVAEEGRLWCDFYTSRLNGAMFNGMPLHWILPGYFFRLFGFTFFGARLFYVSLSALTLIGVYFFSKKLFDEKIALYSVVSLASCYIFFHNSRQVMPQVPAALFSVMAVLVFYAARDSRLNTLFAASGFLTALASLSHPTGLGMFFVITVLFFYKRTPLGLYLLYLAGFLLTVLPYVLYIAANLHEYVRQMSYIFQEFYPRQNTLLNMLDEIPVRYFGMPPIKSIFLKRAIGNKFCNDYFYLLGWGMTSLDLRIVFCELAAKVPLILSLVYVGLAKFKTQARKDLFLIAGLYILLMSVHPNKFGPYIYLVAPYLAICLSVSFRELTKKGVSGRPGIGRLVAAAVMAAFLLPNYALIYNELTTKKVKSYGRFIREAESRIPKGSTVAAPAYFWLGMRQDYNFISANQVVYEIEGMMRREKRGAKFEDLPVGGQADMIRTVFDRHKIQYVLMTCHHWETITEAPSLTAGAGNALRRYLFYNAEIEKDYLRSNYCRDMPPAARFEDEVYEPPPGSSFNNVSEEYQNSLKVYRVR